jgi:hypothetical protein
MRKKKVLILFSVIVTFAVVLGFSIGNWNDKTTAVDYINNGGPTNTVATDNSSWTGETDATPVWTNGLNMPAPTRYHGAGVSFTNAGVDYLYCFGGDADGSGGNSSVVSIYNITANTWSTGAPMPSTLVFYTSATRIGTTAYVVGGIGPGGAFTSMVNEVKRYNLSTNTWLTNAANYPTTVADGKACGYQDSLMYVCGGLTNGTSTATANVNLYNSVSNTWRPATPLPGARSGGAMTIKNDTIVYVCGGTGYSSGLVNTVYRGVISQSDRSVITWTTGAVYPGSARHRFDAAPWGCQGIIVGAGSLSGFTTTNVVYRYSPGADTWTAMPNCPNLTSAPFLGAVAGAGNVWKLVMAAGLVLSPPYSIPQVQILTDTLCPAPPAVPLCEQFTSTTFPPTGWNLIFTGTQYWTRSAVSGFGLGSGSARYDMWNGPAGTNQTMQTVNFTPSIICTQGNIPDSLMIDFAYSVYQTAQDSLIILVSTDGGTSYNSFRRLGPSQLSTTAPQTTEFTPTAGQWVKRAYALPAGVNKIQFLGKSQFGNHLYLDSICIKSCMTGITPISIEPAEFSLSQNYPNPFNPTTNIKFSLPKAGIVKLVVFDVLGREVATLVNEFKGVGQYVVDFDASSLASGVYFYKIETGDFKDVKKMLLVK